MPELPEVDQFTEYINRTALHKVITEIQVQTKSLIYKATAKDFKKTLVGKQFKHARRRGKFTIITLEDADQYVVMHFGMTGSVLYKKQKNLTDDEKEYAQVRFIFDNGYVLAWVNKRKFGKIYLVSSPDEIATLKNMGPEPLDLSQKEFLDLLGQHERKNIKAFLMDQSDIAGIGNEYSNEILFQAGVNPHHGIKDLSIRVRKKVYMVMQRVLKKALGVDTVDQEYPRAWLLAHAKGDMQCPKGDHALKKETVAGRSAVYCPEHQK